MNHQLKLALADSINEVGGVNHFHIFMDKLCTLSSRSPMNQCRIAECAAELDQVMNTIGRIFEWSVRSEQFQWHGLDTALYSAIFRKPKKCFYCLFNKLIKRCVYFIESLKEKTSTRILEAQIAINNGQFCSMPLTDNTKMSSINQQQLLSSFLTVINGLPICLYGMVKRRNRIFVQDSKLTQTRQKMLTRIILTIATVFLKN
ncbi:hypothetical protein PR048_025135 [Dryococelus australis]|uniref:Uncharacterized protein n=1 Tax=Dryococelus australis TaxID=614101 RepID=A0ABQ9GQL5_9NEOP|nr:hypothetical protein PR048_025135 [Dryococelus australis]